MTIAEGLRSPSVSPLSSLIVDVRFRFRNDLLLNNGVLPGKIHKTGTTIAAVTYKVRDLSPSPVALSDETFVVVEGRRGDRSGQSLYGGKHHLRRQRAEDPSFVGQYLCVGRGHIGRL